MRGGPPRGRDATRSAHDLVDEAAVALQSGALPVQVQAAQPAELLSATGGSGATVNEARKYGSGTHALVGHLLRAPHHATVPRHQLPDGVGGPGSVVRVHAAHQTAAAPGDDGHRFLRCAVVRQDGGDGTEDLVAIVRRVQAEVGEDRRTDHQPAGIRAAGDDRPPVFRHGVQIRSDLAIVLLGGEGGELGSRVLRVPDDEGVWEALFEGLACVSEASPAAASAAAAKIDLSRWWPNIVTKAKRVSNASGTRSKPILNLSQTLPEPVPKASLT